jgi:hypothetical protein
MIKCTEIQAIEIRAEIQDALCRCLESDHDTLRKALPGLFEESLPELTHRGLLSKDYAVGTLKNECTGDLTILMRNITIIIAVHAKAIATLVETEKEKDPP